MARELLLLHGSEIVSSACDRGVTQAPVSVADAGHLRWLLGGDCRGDAGLCSSWGDMVRAAERFAKSAPKPDPWPDVRLPPTQTIECHETFSRQPGAMDERMLEAAKRLRLLLRRWRALSPASATTLQLVYGQAMPATGWGDLWPIVLGLPAAREAHRRAATKLRRVDWLQRLPYLSGSREAFHGLQVKAQAVLVKAGYEWGGTWRA